MKRDNFRNLVKQIVRSLRRDQTESEKILWQAIRNRKISGKKFLRQHPIIFKWESRKRFIITDFYCHESKLIVELDGGIHEDQKEYDELRNYIAKSLGFKVIRFKNEMIIYNLSEVIEILNKNTLITPSLHKRGGETVPRGGGEFYA